MENIDEIESEIIELIDKELEINSSLIGISFGSSGGSYIASKFKLEKSDMTQTELAAATSSLIFLSNNILKESLNQEVSYNLIAGEKLILISMQINDLTMIAYNTRDLAELEGIDMIIKNLKEFGLKIAAIVTTSDLIKEEIFVAIKRAIPNALIIAITTKEGLPIKIQSNMPESAISANISALFHLSDVLSTNLEFSIIAGDIGSIIIHELDESRILCVAVPAIEEAKLGSYIVKIKDIIEKAS